MSDKELDDFFRKGLDEPEIPFVKEDWDKMQEKMMHLPGNRKAGGFYRNKWLLVGLGLALIGALSWWGIGAFDKSYPQGNSNEIEQEENQVILENPSGTEKMTSKQDQGITNADENKEDGGSDPIDHSGNSNGISSLQTKSSIHEMDRSKVATDEPDDSYSRRNNGDLIVGSINKSLPVFEQDKELELVFDMEDDGVVPVKKSKSKISQRWSFSLLLSPDVSALKLKEVRGVGTSAGINIEYYFLPKWSLNLGALYAFKTYETSDGYQFSYPSSKPITWLEGDCYVLDIPLNIRYYAINSPMDRWYISSGLSSYLMLKEKYQLVNGYSSYYPNYENLEIRNKNQHYFQVLNISMGYERRLSEKLSIQVEPYLKLPLKGVGEGQVSLKSAGALIGLKYNW